MKHYLGEKTSLPNRITKQVISLVTYMWLIYTYWLSNIIGSSININNPWSLSIIVFLSIPSLSFFIISKQHYLYIQYFFKDFIINNNFIENLNTRWPWSPPSITTILDIPLSINRLKLINKVVFLIYKRNHEFNIK